MAMEPTIKCSLLSIMPTHTHQMGKCKDFELRMIDCLEAYGANREGQEKCADYIADLNECSGMGKQKERVKLMRLERIRQYKAGERKEVWEKPPPEDAY